MHGYAWRLVHGLPKSNEQSVIRVCTGSYQLCGEAPRPVGGDERLLKMFELVWWPSFGLRDANYEVG